MPKKTVAGDSQRARCMHPCMATSASTPLALADRGLCSAASKRLRLRAFFGRFNKVYEACLFRPSRFQRCAI